MKILDVAMKVITILSVVALLFALCCMDSESLVVPVKMAIISGVITAGCGFYWKKRYDSRCK